MRKYLTIAALLLLPFASGCRFIAVGDSILWGSQNAVRTAVHDDPARNDDVHVDAIIGRGLWDSPFVAGSKSLWQVVSELAPVVAENGTLVVQDGAYDGGEVQLRTFIRNVNAEVRPDVCLVWVYPFDARRPDTDALVRRVLDEETVGRRHTIVDWYAIASAQPAVMTSDGVHPTPAGQLAFAELLAGARCA